MRYKVVRCPSCVVCEPRTQDPKSQCPATDHGPRTSCSAQCPTLPDPTVRPSTSRPKCARGQPPGPRRLAPRRRPPVPDGRPALPPLPGAAGETGAARESGTRDSGLGTRKKSRDSEFGVRGSQTKTADQRRFSASPQPRVPSPDLCLRTPNPESRTPSPNPHTSRPGIASSETRPADGYPPTPASRHFPFLPRRQCAPASALAFPGQARGEETIRLAPRVASLVRPPASPSPPAPAAGPIAGSAAAVSKAAWNCAWERANGWSMNDCPQKRDWGLGTGDWKKMMKDE